ncbi:ribonuclease H [Paenibacillus caui]|uniref:ribonuclease H n=1 Tax=Paenibacillus caui TaxID=2873927 RepID=UPI001CAA1155
MAGQKYYVVWEGKTPGVYSSWAECQKQTSQYPNAKYKSYSSKVEAEAAYKAGWKGNWGCGAQKGGRGTASAKAAGSGFASAEINYNSISVDVGTRGNPGPVEYKGVDTASGEVIFSVGPISKGTNNLGEFLAIVHALAHLKKTGSDKVIYSDSENAINWVRKKAVSTTLVRDDSTAEIWGLVDRALNWLHSNKYETQILKWQTKRWGEIKADYGRK